MEVLSGGEIVNRRNVSSLREREREREIEIDR